MHDVLTLGLAIASPIFSVMFGVLVNQRALDKTEARLDARFNRVDQRLDRMDGRLDRLDQTIDDLKAEQSRFFETLASHDAKIGILMDERRKA